jgi:hypothetical protein
MFGSSFVSVSSCVDVDVELDVDVDVDVFLFRLLFDFEDVLFVFRLLFFGSSFNQNDTCSLGLE